MIPPLPKGEGGGEGESDNRKSNTKRFSISAITNWVNYKIQGSGSAACTRAKSSVSSAWPPGHFQYSVCPSQNENVQPDE